MESSRNDFIFSICWRLTLVLLPWQTRWFFEGQTIAGQIWEQGRWSIYLSWLPMFAAVMFGLWSKPKALNGKSAKILFISIAGLAVITLLGGSEAMEAKLQWWLQILIAISFTAILIRKQVTPEKISTWFILSLIAPAVLGLVQFFYQSIFASSWMGMAAHSASQLGAAVVENSSGRLLRAYGTFPHPNIFGGWLAAGIVAGVQLYKNIEDKYRHWLLVTLALMSTNLILTFSRSVWLATGLGLATLLATVLIKAGDKKMLLKNIAAPFAVIIIAVAIFGSLNWPYIVSRSTGEGRLETKSTSERLVSWQNGWEVFKAAPFFGTGPNAELVTLEKISKDREVIIPLESPHNVWLLFLDNFGIAGVVLMIYALIFLSRNSKFEILNSNLSLLAVLLTVSMFDHYLWSYWPGNVLLILMAFFTLNFSLSHIKDGS